ncbi:hypothetical protein ACFX19_017118 [Malus domestica]
MLIFSSDRTIPKGPRRFLYDSRLGKNSKCRDIIADAYGELVEGSLAFKVSEKLKGTQYRLGLWKKTTKLNSERHIEELRAEIKKGIVDVHARQEHIKANEKELAVAIREK